MTRVSSSRWRALLRRVSRLLYGAGLRAFRFDADFYRSTYGDVAQFSEHDCRAHWRTTGWQHGRFPSLAAVTFHAKLRGIDLTNADPLSYIVFKPEIIAQGVVTREATLVRMASDSEWAHNPHSFACPSEYLDTLAKADVDDSWSYRGSAGGNANAPTATALELALQQLSAEGFVVETHRHFMGYPPGMKQLQEWVATLDAGATWRPTVLSILIDLGPLSPAAISTQTTLAQVVAASIGTDITRARAGAGAARADDEYSLMGIPAVPRSEWDARAIAVATDSAKNVTASYPHSPGKESAHVPTTHEAPPVVSVLVSLFRCETFLPAWIENVLGLNNLHECEFFIVVVDATARERVLLDSLAARSPRIRVSYVEGPCGIYTAWNTALAATSAPYVTNMNVDDLRSPDSLAVQRATLDAYPWVDVVTNDVIVTFEPAESWNQVDASGAVARFPLTTLPLLQSGVNVPHNGPMWRRSLHDELGLFDDSLTSSADWEFWMRCARAGKNFFAIPRATVSYFDNPRGLSTSNTGASLEETRRILDVNRDALIFGSAPSYALQPAAFGPVMTRAARLERGFVSELTRLRSERAVSGENS